MTIKLALFLICGVFWSVAYIDIIRVGIKDKTYGMPFLALALNFSWELYNTILGCLAVGVHISTSINCVWVFIDLAILYTYFKYGNKECKKSNKAFYGLSFLIVGFSFVFQAIIDEYFGLVTGALYSAFWSNLLMSILFIRFLYTRKGQQGQSLLIAITKCIGTLAATLLIGIVGLIIIDGPLQSTLYVGLVTFVIDLLYIVLLYKRRNSHFSN